MGMDDEHSYKMKINIQCCEGGVKPSQLGENTETNMNGACDCAAVMLGCRSPDGSLMAAIMTMNGEGGPMPSSEIWLMWVAMADVMAADVGMTPFQRATATAVAVSARTFTSLSLAVATEPAANGVAVDDIPDSSGLVDIFKVVSEGDPEGN